MTTNHLELFNECRPALLSLAGRILGNLSEAEDMVQETYLRWQKTDPAEVRSPKAFLTTTLTRLCLNQLNLARVKLVHDEGTISADLFPAHTAGPDQYAELADALSEAFGRMLTNLSPVETAVFLLREAFEFDYSEIAPIVERTPENCRQILKRAREHIHRGQSPTDASSQHHQRMAQLFREAVDTGELDSLLNSLSEDAVLVRDAGDLSRPSRPPISGETLRAELRALAAEWLVPASRLVVGEFSGRPVILVENRATLSGAFLLDVDQVQVRSIRVVTCPAVLRQLKVLLALQFSSSINN